MDLFLCCGNRFLRWKLLGNLILGKKNDEIHASLCWSSSLFDYRWLKSWIWSRNRLRFKTRTFTKLIPRYFSWLKVNGRRWRPSRKSQSRPTTISAQKSCRRRNQKRKWRRNEVKLEEPMFLPLLWWFAHLFRTWSIRWSYGTVIDMRVVFLCLRACSSDKRIQLFVWVRRGHFVRLSSFLC